MSNNRVADQNKLADYIQLIQAIKDLVAFLMKDETNRNIRHARGLAQMKRILQRLEYYHPNMYRKGMFHSKHQLDEKDCVKILKQLNTVAIKRLAITKHEKTRDDQGRDILYEAIKQIKPDSLSTEDPSIIKTEIDHFKENISEPLKVVLAENKKNNDNNNLQARLKKFEILYDIRTLVDHLLLDEKNRGVGQSRGLLQMKRLLDKLKTKDKDMQAVGLISLDLTDSQLSKAIRQLQAIANKRTKKSYVSRDENCRGNLYALLKDMNPTNPQPTIEKMKKVEMEIHQKIRENCISPPPPLKNRREQRKSGQIFFSPLNTPSEDIDAIFNELDNPTPDKKGYK